MVIYWYNLWKKEQWRRTFSPAIVEGPSTATTRKMWSVSMQAREAIKFSAYAERVRASQVTQSFPIQWPCGGPLNSRKGPRSIWLASTVARRGQNARSSRWCVAAERCQSSSLVWFRTSPARAASAFHRWRHGAPTMKALEEDSGTRDPGRWHSWSSFGERN